MPIVNKIYIPRIGDDKTKDKTIEFLIQENKLSLRELAYRVTKRASVTYQAVYKAVRELLEKEIIAKEENQYKINKKWIISLKNFVKYVEQNHQEVLQKLRKEKTANLQFKSLVDAARFILTFINVFLEDSVKLKGDKIT